MTLIPPEDDDYSDPGFTRPPARPEIVISLMTDQSLAGYGICLDTSMANSSTQHDAAACYQL